jgi:hypothetical protein
MKLLPEIQYVGVVKDLPTYLEDCPETIGVLCVFWLHPSGNRTLKVALTEEDLETSMTWWMHLKHVLVLGPLDEQSIANTSCI